MAEHTMLVAAVRKTGPAEAIQLLQQPVPSPGKGEVLVEQHASSVNPIDVKVRAGLVMPLLMRRPKVLGGDLAGVVLDAGSSTRYAVGDRVFGQLDTFSPLRSSGTYAEKVVAREEWLAPIPPGITFQQAAAICTVGLTAWQALRPDSIQPGQRVLIHAGAGGVGHVAVQLAKAQGAYVITTASAASADFLKGLGADQVLDYKTTAFDTALRSHKVDLVLDTVGGDYTARSLSVLKRSGRFAHVLNLGWHTRHGYPNALAIAREFGQIGLGKLKALLKLGPAYSLTTVHPNGGQMGKLAALMAAGKLAVHIDRVFPLKQASAAHRHLESGHPRGKVVLSMKHGAEE